MVYSREIIVVFPFLVKLCPSTKYNKISINIWKLLKVKLFLSLSDYLEAKVI